jgi:hypothetical protein
MLDLWFEEKLIPRLNDIVQKEVAKNMERKFPKLYTREQVMEMLHVGETTLWNWEKKEILVPVRVGKNVLYTEDEIKRVLDL